MHLGENLEFTGTINGLTSGQLALLNTIDTTKGLIEQQIHDVETIFSNYLFLLSANTNTIRAYL